MKKMFFLFSFLFLLTLTYSFKPVFYDINNFKNINYGEIIYSIYCLDKCENIENCEIINLGNGYIINTSLNNAKVIKSKVTNILGESIKFKSTINKINNIINYYNLNIIKKEKVDNIFCAYGFSNVLAQSNYIKIDNEKINLQIAFSNNYITLGYPIILGDY
ncbi:MAG: hypothetical protein E7359_02250 [Clostridiales bacterium]|nr:hypothetical protein [Clostridiales bacterium]